MAKNLTGENVFRILIKFSLPYLLSCFLQTFYGLADLFIIGQFNDSASISAVSIGSQVMHMLTVIIAGLAMGSTVCISRAVGAGDDKSVSKNIGNTVSVFLLFSLFATFLLILCTDPILSVISTPVEARAETRNYLLICFAGVPFITAYNVVSSIFRGIGDTKSPMYFVFAAGVINILLDYILIGPLHMGAAGAALATVTSQGISVLLALIAMKRKNRGISLSKNDFIFENNTLLHMLKVGIPIAFQDGLIQVSFLVITAIANQRGVTIAASVGIVEKIICFVFLVPSAMLSSVSAIAAQNAGAGKHAQGIKALKYGIIICLTFGMTVSVICQFVSEPFVALFAGGDKEIIRLGGQYLRSYIFDCAIAGVHFCFSGYFCAYGKAFFSFIHNLISIIALRIPGAYLAALYFPESLYPMGMAAPLGSLLSAIICLILFHSCFRNKNL